MVRRPALTIGVVVLCVLTGFVVYFFFFSASVTRSVDESGEEKTRQQHIDEAQIVANDVELVQGRKGVMEWKLLAKTAKYNQESKLVGVAIPRLTAFYGEDRREVFIRADKGEVDQANDNLTLYDNVIGRFGKLDLTAPYLDYIGAEDKVFLKGGVTMQKPELTLSADEAELNLQTRVLEATGNIEAIISSVGLNK